MSSDAVAAVAAVGAQLLPPGFARWRAKAREFLAGGVAPERAVWEGRQLHFQEPPQRHAQPGAAAVVDSRVPRAFLQLALWVACHRDAERWALLYRLLWRIAHGERELLQVATDPDVHRALMLAKAARRAAHKMKAFVRFRRALSPADADEQDARYIAWFEPAHHVVERVTPFFAERFAGMRWSILTPERCVHWDGVEATFTAGVSPEAAIRVDAFEDLWREYYASIFNPARLAPGVMRAEMPMSYWKNLPEAQLISGLSREAPRRVAEMIARAELPPMPIPAEYAMAGAPATPPRMRAAVQPVGRQRRSGLDLPSWDPVLDPGPEVARARAEALRFTSGRAVQCGDVRVLPGVAGWTDASLLAPGVFYPDHVVTPEDRLRFYASRYAMVEVDSTYYALPRREHAVAWVQRTPDDFVFNVKAHALMTGHGADLRRLPDWLRRDARAQANDGIVYGSDLADAQLDELWQRYLAALTPLSAAGKLGAIFLQFPRWFEPGPRAERALNRIAARLGDVRGAIEFRNPAWGEPAVSERAFALLRDLLLAYTVVDAPQGTSSSMPPLVRVTRDDFAVLRLHGRRVDRWEARNEFVTERYRYLYTREQVTEWARQALFMTSLMHGGMLQVSYNNNHANYATTNAAEFGEDLESPRHRLQHSLLD